MQSVKYKLTELFIIFILIPVSFLFTYNPLLKLMIGVLGFCYVIYILIKIEKVPVKNHSKISWKQFWIKTGITFFTIALVTTFFVWYTDNENLFKVVLNKPKLWITILCFYSFFSVYPQELLYRTFFFKRYNSLFKNKTVLIIINAVLFSVAHVLFKNTLVLILTFIGGILFAITYKKHNSVLLVSIEHAIYGCWLFTVGMGDMLGFPS